MLLEHQGLNIGQLHLVIDDREIEFGEFFGDFFNARGHAERHGDDRAGALLGHAAQGLLAL